MLHLAAQHEPENLGEMLTSEQIAAIHALGTTAYPMQVSAKEVAWMRRGKGVYTSSDVLKDPKAGPSMRAPALAMGFSYAQMGATMFSGDRCIGSIVVNRLAGDGFTAKEQALLMSFADQAVVAIQNARLFNETQEALERQTATAEILKVIASSPSDVQPVLDVVARRAAELCDADWDTVWLLSGATLRLAAHALRAVERSPVDEPGQLEMPLQASTPSARAAALGTVVQVDDIMPLLDTDYPDARAMQQRFGFRAMLSVPMMREGSAIGVIGLNRRDARPFRPDEVALVQTFADQAVIAIQNTRLFNETQEALEQQTASAEVLQVIGSSVSDTAPVFERILSSAQRILSTNYVNIGLIGDDGLVHLNVNDTSLFPDDPMYPKVVEWLHREFPAPVRDTVHGYCAHKRVVLHYPDAQHGPDVPPKMREATAWMGNSSLLWVPLVWNGKGIGAFGVARLPMKPFSDKEIALIKTFADQAVIAIQNAKMFNDTQQALERQTATAEILKVIAGSPDDVQPVFDAIAQSANRLAGAFSTVVTVRRDDMLHLAAFTTTDPSGVERLKSLYPRPLSADSEFGRVVLEGRALQIADTEAATDLSPGLLEHARARGIRSLLFCPLMRERVAIGVISVSRKEPGGFSAHQVELISTFADQAVIAIENVRLFNETQEALERQTATTEVLQVINASPGDLDPVFDAIMRNATQLCDASGGGLWMVEGDVARGARGPWWAHAPGVLRLSRRQGRAAAIPAEHGPARRRLLPHRRSEGPAGV